MWFLERSQDPLKSTEIRLGQMFLPSFVEIGSQILDLIL